MYKRYRRPHYRILEAFSLPLPKNAYDEFWALRDISLEVRRGDSLGIIGQNGAGKSTLLSIICGRLQPTSGKVTVHGNIQALMDMGTGFHPEFTGRENIFTSLAFQGVTGRTAADLYDEIVEFSELAEFIDQPIKTYSSGMYARLAFSTATAITPDVLIIDEILGAGDAYFASKCVERMHRLTREVGATVLFVSHDITSVQRLCEHAIWIDRGQIKMAGASLDISKSYYADVLAREEARLRAETSRALARMRRREGITNLSEGKGTLLFHLVTADGQPPRNSHPIRRVALLTGDGRRLQLDVGAPMDNDERQDAYLATDPNFMLWGAATTIDGAAVRCFEDTGGTFRHAPIFFQGSSDVVVDAEAIEIEHAVKLGEELAVEIHESDGYRRLGLLTPVADAGSWRAETISIRREAARDLVPAAVRQPIGDASLDDTHSLAAKASAPVSAAGVDVEARWATSQARFLDAVLSDVDAAKSRFVFGLGEPILLKIVTQLDVAVPVCWLAVIIYDLSGNRISLTVHKFENGLDCGTYDILAKLKNPGLRQGDYVISLDLLPEYQEDWQQGRLPFLCHWDRSVYFKINENYHGTIPFGIVAMPMAVTIHPLKEAQAGAGSSIRLSQAHSLSHKASTNE